MTRGEGLAFVVGSGATAVLMFAAGFLQEAGRSAARAAGSWAGSRSRFWNVWRAARRAAKTKATQAREDAKKAAESAERRSALEAERVGAVFHVQEGRDDVGGTATVLELASSDWDRSVLLETRFPDGREPAELSPVHERPGGENELVQRFQTQWAPLVMPEDAQRHKNARLAGLDDDTEGWVTYKRII